MLEQEGGVSDAPAIAIGCVVGLVLGAGFGAMLVTLLDDLGSDTWMIVMMHSMLAMMVMGGWTAPSLMSRE